MTVHPFAWPNARAIIPLQAITGPTQYHNRVPVINGHQHLSAIKSLTGHKRTTVPDRSNRSSPLGHRVRHNAPCSRHGESEHKTKRVSSGRRAENRREPGQNQHPSPAHLHLQPTGRQHSPTPTPTLTDPSPEPGGRPNRLSACRPSNPDHPPIPKTLTGLTQLYASTSVIAMKITLSSFPRKNGRPRT